MQTERRRPGFHSLRSAIYKLPAVISSTFLLLRLFALLCGHNSARYQQPATRQFFNRHKKSYNFSLSESQPFSFSPPSRYQQPATRYCSVAISLQNQIAGIHS
jgi:hypothetical protein